MALEFIAITAFSLHIKNTKSIVHKMVFYTFIRHINNEDLIKTMDPRAVKNITLYQLYWYNYKLYGIRRIIRMIILYNIVVRFPPCELFVYVKFPAISRICGNVLTQQWFVCKITIWTQAVNPLPLCTVKAFIYPPPVPSIHEWLWFRLFWHKI